MQDRPNCITLRFLRFIKRLPWLLSRMLWCAYFLVGESCFVEVVRTQIIVQAEFNFVCDIFNSLSKDDLNPFRRPQILAPQIMIVDKVCIVFRATELLLFVLLIRPLRFPLSLRFETSVSLVPEAPCEDHLLIFWLKHNWILWFFWLCWSGPDCGTRGLYKCFQVLVFASYNL